mmetsp:Transcript_44123/g.54064  ORF Transcript_44123/g.54064 Transcript_44123/m.54064 type:complete len:259 (-) Transcript_44123:36-812(-)
MFTSNRLDYGVNTFSPEGRLFQVEYALEAIKLGSTALGIQTKDGVLLAVEKRIESPLMVPKSNTKVFEIDSHIGAVYSGLQADGKSLIDYARVQAQSYWFTYDEPIPIKSLTRLVADHMMSFGGTDDDDDDNNRNKKKMSRPFGVALLIAGIDNDGPALYVIDPSGTIVRYLAVAVGAGGESAMSTLQDRYAKSMNLRESEDLGAEILKQVMEDKISNINCEISLLNMSNKKYNKYNDKQISDVLSRLKRDEFDNDDE